MGDLATLVDEVVRVLSASPMLAREGDVDASREARWIAAHVLDVTVGELARRLAVKAPLADADQDRILVVALRRARGEPLAYCLGTAPFRHLELHVDARVLIPRPETEVVVGEALRVAAERPGGIAVDIGTGSGAIALSLATEGRFERVVATDISLDALAVASANAVRVRREQPSSAPVEFRHGADLAPLHGIQARVIVSNPPYIAYDEAESLPRSVRDWEPPVALLAADRGMARYAAILDGAQALLEPYGWVIFEVDSRRALDTEALARARGYQQLQVVRDLTGRDRVLLAQYVPTVPTHLSS